MVVERPETRARAAENLGLRDAARAFVGHGSPRAIAVALLAAVAGRVGIGGWSWWDLLGPAAVVAAQPFTEWTIHVVLLHFRPRTIGRLRVDPLVARKHRAHHADPRDPVLVFIPLPALAGLPLERGLTTLVAALAVLATYEWTHYLIHSSYRPRHALYRYVWRAHRNHHFRNEHYWFGVTVHLADHVLGTFPDRSAVPLSATARTLGVADAA